MTTVSFPLEKEASLFLPGAIGELEAITTYPAGEIKGVAVICHPHPLYAGTMHNKVVHTLARSLNELNLATVRFNYRGVGNSVGSYDHGIGETEDALAIIHWVEQVLPGKEIWLTGFSFGSFVAARAAAIHQNVKQLITVAPSVEHFDFSTITHVPCPWLVIQGEKDEIVPPEKVYAWAAKQNHTLELVRVPEVGHFFHGALIQLKEIILERFTR